MKNNKKRGFTLVELLVVIAILAILATVAVVGYSSFMTRARVSNDEEVANQLNDYWTALKADSMDDYYGKDITQDNVWYITQTILNKTGLGSYVPQSLRDGYHLYFKFNENGINGEYVVKKESELTDSYGNPLMRLLSVLGIHAAHDKKYDMPGIFYEGNIMYFLVDTHGSDIANAVRGFYTFDGFENGDSDFVALVTSSAFKDAYPDIYDKYTRSVIATENGTYGTTGNFLFVHEGTTVIGKVTINAGRNMVITIPAGVTLYEGNLTFNPPSNVTLDFLAESWEGIAPGFANPGTNIENGDYNGSVGNNGNPTGGNGGSGEGDETLPDVELTPNQKPVTNFDIILKSTYGKLFSNGYLYVPYEKGSVELGVKINDSAYTSDEMIWNIAETDAKATINNGVVTFNELPASDKCEITITATPKIGGEDPVTEAIKLVIVRVTDTTIHIDGAANDVSLATSDDFTITLDYVAGASLKYTIGTTVTTNNTTTETSLDPNTTVKITYVSGPSFSVVADDNTFTLNTVETDGEQKIVPGENKINVKVGAKDSYYYDQDITIIVRDRTKAAFVSLFTKEFTKDGYSAPYRVGNRNAFSLGTMFARNWDETPEDVELVITNVITGATLTSQTSFSSLPSTLEVKYGYTKNNTWNNASIDTEGDGWANTSIQFAGTGVAKIAIMVEGEEVASEVVEIVDGKNVVKSSDLSGGTSYVLLTNVTSGGFTLTNATLYGNGFEINIKGASSKMHGIIYMSDATIDNTRIIGDVYQSVSMTYNTDNFASAVQSVTGNNVISNSYISGCASPLKTSSDSLLIENTILYGGTFCNLDIGSGKVTLRNVVTFNQTNDDRGVVGLGIVVAKEATTVKIILEGYLNQFNFVCKDDESKVKNTYASALVSVVYGGDFDAYISDDEYINTGILSMSEDVVLKNDTGSSLIDNRTNKQNYASTPASIAGYSGYLYAPKPNGNYADKRDSYEETSRTQGGYIPKFAWNLGDQEISYEGDSDDRYLYRDGDTIKVLFKQGSTPISLDLSSMATISKYLGQNFTSIVTECDKVAEDGTRTPVTLTRNVVSFTEAGKYVVKFTIEDNRLYDQNGNLSSAKISHTYEVPVTVEIVKADHKNAEVQLSGNTYQHYVNYMDTNGCGDYDYGHAAPVFGSLTIVDYDENGNATTLDLMSYVSVTSTGNLKNGGTVTFTYSGNRTLVLTFTASSAASNADGQCEFSMKKYNNILYMVTAGGTDEQKSVNGHVTFTKYQFTGSNGKMIEKAAELKYTFTKDIPTMKQSSFK